MTDDDDRRVREGAEVLVGCAAMLVVLLTAFTLWVLIIWATARAIT